MAVLFLCGTVMETSVPSIISGTQILPVKVQ